MDQAPFFFTKEKRMSWALEISRPLTLRVVVSLQGHWAESPETLSAEAEQASCTLEPG